MQEIAYVKADRLKLEGIRELDPEELKIFIESVYKVLGEEGLKDVRKNTYWYKYNTMKRHIGGILKDLRERGYNDLASKVYVNGDTYYTNACCKAEKFFNPLGEEEKFLVLLKCFKIFNHKQEMETNENNKVYRDEKTFVKELDNGTIEDWDISAFGYINDIEKELNFKYTASDILYWLQTEWRDLSGDYFRKNKLVFTRGYTTFTPRHYRSFNVIFKRVIGRDLKCIDKYKEEKDKSLIDLLKEEL